MSLEETYPEITAEVWPIVIDTIAELFTRRADVLADYVNTNGATDWVWLEETLSLYTGERLPKAPHHVSYLRYLVAFSLAIDAIRTKYPNVRGPSWHGVEARAMALDSMKALIDAGEDPDDVIAFIQDAALDCDDDDDSRSSAGDNCYGDIEDVVADFQNFKARHAADIESPYCKPRHVFMRHAVRDDLIDRGHHPSFVDAFIASRTDTYWTSANYESVAHDFAIWKRNSY